MMPSLTRSMDHKHLKLTRLRQTDGQELTVHLLKTNKLRLPTLIIDLTMDKSLALPTLRLASMRSSTEMGSNHGLFTFMSHQVWSFTHTNCLMYSKLSRAPAIQLVVPWSKSMVRGSITNPSMVLFHTASLETPLYELTLIPP
jgi:hypothetical protein